ncbi:DUF4150 domain-containing protein [Zooshikella sp. RANM57]|uniref:DUF4150 domain-containing protein n=1 Tax=Zooshikella sp. RANM57 TaxID=3425863 RepID=UPI003D6FF9C7
MFANNNLSVMNFAFPDVCYEPTPGPVPFPLLNMAFSSTHVPSQYQLYFGTGLAENLLTTGTVSTGDETGVELGMVSGMIIGPDLYLMGSTKTFVSVVPATRLTSLTGQNGYISNAIGASLTPGQVVVLLLS